MHADTRIWFCVALVFCVVGDVFLMLPRDAFVPGLASFLVAQLCFAVGFALHLASGAGSRSAIVLVAVVLAALLAIRFLRALLRDGRRSLVVPVLAYIARDRGDGRHRDRRRRGRSRSREPGCSSSPTP